MSNRYLIKEMEKELMLYDRETDEVHILSPVARLIYKMYKDGSPISEIEAEIPKKFHVSGDVDIKTDILKCLEELEKKELVEKK
jgi:hypothetical protein